jgi:hypothetical protein
MIGNQTEAMLFTDGPIYNFSAPMTWMWTWPNKFIEQKTMLRNQTKAARIAIAIGKRMARLIDVVVARHVCILPR